MFFFEIPHVQKNRFFGFVFFHFCFLIPFPTFKKYRFFFGGVYFFDNRHVQKIMSFFLVPTLIWFFLVFRGTECFGFKRCSGTCVSPIFGLNLRIPNPALWKSLFSRGSPVIFFSAARIFILKTCSINWTCIFATAFKNMINIKLFCIYHALLDFFLERQPYIPKQCAITFFLQNLHAPFHEAPAVSAPCSVACAFVAIKQPKHTLRSFAAIKFAMYIATNLGRDCDVLRATSSSELVFVVAIG